jgi:hypothetical protein
MVFIMIITVLEMISPRTKPVLSPIQKSSSLFVTPASAVNEIDLIAILRTGVRAE